MLTKGDLNEIGKIVKSTEVRLDKKFDKGFDRLERKLDYAINFLDRDYLKLPQRVEKIEEHLGIDSPSF